MVLRLITRPDYASIPWKSEELVLRLNTLFQNLKDGLVVNLDELQEALDSPFSDLIFVVDEETGALVGYAELLEWRSATGRAGYIENVVRAKEYHGKGVGDLLGDALDAAAQRRGLKKVWLHSGTWRTDAHKLYDRLGFKTHDTTVRYRTYGKGAQ